MKGKNKLILILFAVMALVATSVSFALKGTIESIKYANAEAVVGFTSQLDGNAIFSAEMVYFAVDEDEDTSNDHESRKGQLNYKGYTFNPIETNNGTEYFGDYSLSRNNYDDSYKKVIDDGDFVMVNDNAVYTADDSTPIKQGIMITLGGYYYYNNDQIRTNTPWIDADGDGDLDFGEVAGWVDINDDNRINEGELQGVTNFEALDNNSDGIIDKNEIANFEVGAHIDYVSVEATLNGNPITLPNARDYNSASYEDFTWFIVPSESTEGHYEISLMYSMSGFAEPVRYDFDFYLLLQSQYDRKVNVNGYDYSSKPFMDYAEGSDTVGYEFFSGTTLNYPTLTFDYARYGLTYTYTSGDETTEVTFDYDEGTQRLSLSQKVYDDIEIDYYPINTDRTNTIVTLMFTDIGKYNLHFDYIYEYQGEKITIPQEQIAFDNIALNIHGYQLKYSKAGFASADMTHLSIYQNNTMFILVNGFTNADNETTGDNLGISYTLTNDTKEVTGTIIDSANATKNSGSESAMIIRSKTFNDIDTMIAGSEIGDFVSNIKYQRTDRGLWFTLRDEYKLENSFYYYRATEEIDEEYITTKTKDLTKYVNRTDFTKVTTFTAPGYYLVQVKYKREGDNTEYTQCFAFQITATTPMLNLRKIDDKEQVDNFYANEYTNQNVYASWAETETFESTVVGKLYYSASRYATENTLKAVADGSFNSSVTKVDYEKNTLITESGSYLLVLEVERSATKTYTYFTIDKEDITGLQVYEVVTNSIDNNAVYTIKQDASLNYITHTSKSVIDSVFTIDWANKASGATITASYKFTPFVKTNLVLDNNTITIEQGQNVYKYIINQYTIGDRSEDIQINKPVRLNSALDVNNVLTDQGIYEFNLIDQAGNKLTYIVVVDRTEGIVNATYGDNKNKYISGQMVADYVELEWGTHKAISLGSIDNEIIQKLINNQDIDNYYTESGNNLFNLRNMFQLISGQNLFVVQNTYTDIKLRPFDSLQDVYYILTSNGNKQIKYPNGATITGWDDTANKLFSNATNMGIKINVDEEEIRRYTFEIVGSNQVASTTNTSFSVYITPDKAQGEVYSSSQEGADYNTSVMAYGGATKYFNDVIEDENVYIEKYYEGQASNDGVFVFEWLVPSDEDNFKVTEVKYNYYQLMDQSTLNSITKQDLKDNKYPYYPYRYVEVSNNYILKTEEDIETVTAYTKTTRTTKDSYGNVIDTKSINQSDALNLAYENYYDTNGNLVSKKVTQTGLYIITRTISITVDEGAEPQTSQMSYAFFVDRNMIVGYSINDINDKIVGQFIHTAMPNSDSANGVKYDNFNKQGLKPQTRIYYDNNKEVTVEYKVYLETNKLPTLLQVPSGKYVSGNVGNMTINATSHLNLNLNLSVYFYDSYGLLPNAYKNSFVRLMNKVTSNKDGYIDLSFSNIDNPGIITSFKNARIQADDNRLSLPGVYVFVIEDTVSSKVNEQFEVYDTNEFVFGIKLTNIAPQTDVYTYADINGNKSSKVYAEDNILYTNQEFVDFIIPVEDKNAYEAQLDIASIEIWRSSASNATNSLWLRLKPGAGGSGFVADTNAIIQNLDRIYWIDVDGNIINQADGDAKERLAGYAIKLDTGLTVVDDQIVDYKEYVYIINIKYILTNSGTQYYTYLDEGVRTTFHTTQYTVTIDRTPNEVNLNNLMQEQGEYFENYHSWLAEQNGKEASDNVNESFAYRNTTTIGDYYGLTNDLYYQFIGQTGELSNQAMYALTVNYNTTFNPNGLSAIYYRKLDFNAAISSNTRMGLLPITEIYGSDYYHSFHENSPSYNFYSPQNDKFKDESTGNIYYRAIMGENGTDANYGNNWGMFYEIIEKDMAGNLTQYVIYFASNISTDVEMTIKGSIIGDSDAEDITLTFVAEANQNQRAFIGIDNISNINGLIGPSTGDTSKKLYPYYANINIYNASREKIKTIYTNSKSDKEDIKQEIYNTIKEEGNYIIEYVDVFGQKKYITINNYTTGEHQLNTATLQVQTDYSNGQKYIKFSGLNTKIDNTYWYVTDIVITYQGKTISYTAGVPENGISVLQYNSLMSTTAENEVSRDVIERDRLNLQVGIQYLVTLTDVGGKDYVVPISTTEGYYAYDLMLPDNIYAYDNIYYTANEVQLSYNTDFYTWHVEVWIDGDMKAYNEEDNNFDDYLIVTQQVGSYKLLTLRPDDITDPADYYGSLRRFIVTLLLNSDEVSQTYEIYIDTRATNFVIENTNKVDKIDYIKSTLKNGVDENGLYQDYNILDLINSKYYNQLISETINISWTRLTSDYFTYNYELFEFVNKDEYVNLLQSSSDNEYSIAPKENTTGKYILKVTIEGKDGTWIASRLFAIYMSTTITGLYEVKDGLGNLYDYASITNLDEIYYDANSICTNKTSVALALGFNNIAEMESVFESFGRKTAIPMYIANTSLTLHSNQDNGVNSLYYQPIGSSYATISFYRVWRSNYLTFAVIMEVYPTDRTQNILSVLSFSTSPTQDAESLLNNGVAKTIYNANAEFYRLTFNSYNKNTASNLLEQHNKIIIDVYYNNVFAKRIKGGNAPTTSIEFKNSGSYKLVIKDEAGNVQYFSNNTTYLDNFTVIVMKDMLYTVNNEAPIPYAYYDSAVTLQINRYNSAIGKNNYDINTIKLTAIRNSKAYTGYEHPTESSTYIFRDYGTYLITISAKLLGTNIEVSSQLVFTILNPNEARTALDFTSIYGYNIISVFSITKTAEKDVTDKFMELLQDKSNTGEINVYNKLVTYERLTETFGTSTQGKMKFRVLYEVENDDLLPARRAEFSFTLNNETATITSSIKAGEKTTDNVTLKFNAANIYDQIGDCNLVINGEVVLRIDESSSNSITEIKVTEVGQYYIQLVGDSGTVAHSFNFTIKEPLNTVAIILIVIISAIVIALIGTFIWLRTRMKVR